jgi:hypothetical protein
MDEISWFIKLKRKDDEEKQVLCPLDTLYQKSLLWPLAFLYSFP